MLRAVPMSGRRRRRRPDFVLWLPAALLVACEEGSVPIRGDTVELDAGEVRLQPGATVHTITFATADGPDRFVPDAVFASPGDALRFQTSDRHVHALSFERDDGLLARFLEETEQVRSPPLVNEDQAWVISLEAAPAGAIGFTCTLHGGSGRLRIHR